MPVFQYKGYKADGAETSGAIEANGLNDAISKIKDSGLFPKEVKEHAYGGKRFLFRDDDASLLPVITRQLSMLLSSGVPLMEALKSLAEENKGFWKRALIDIREKTAGGLSLSMAMAGHRIFPEFYLNMTAAGEAGGSLGSVLSRVADFLERNDAIKSRIRAAMIYPVFMACIGFIVLSFLFTLVVPKIVRIFEDTKNTLPFITVILINISNFFRDYWWLIAAVFIGGVTGFKKIREKNPLLTDRIILKLPGNIIQSLYLARFARTLGFLLDGGIPLLRALELSSKSAGNREIAGRIKEAGVRVAGGARLSASLEGFPPVFLQLISTGEKGGRLVEVLNKAADSYEDEFSRKVQKGLAMLEPVMILMMGAIVGFIVFAVLLPMFQLNQLVK